MKEIAKVNWNGHTYTFTNTYHNTGTKSHDVLTMTDENGNEWVGETTWINRPWHRFDLEEAFNEIVGKAFGQKALEQLREINKEAYSVTDAIQKFFGQLKPEDVVASKEEPSEFPDYDKRKQALANYLGISVDDVEEGYDENEFTTSEGDYVVLTDEEAEEKYDERIRNDIDELDLHDFGGDLMSLIIENAIDEDAVKDNYEDSEREEVDYLDEDDIVDECINAGIIEYEDAYNEDDEPMFDALDFDDLKDKLVDYRMEDFDVTDIDWESRGDYREYLDYDKAAEVIKDYLDTNGTGRGSELSYYDGNEIELDDNLYAYRID